MYLLQKTSDKCQFYVILDIIFGTYLTCVFILFIILTPKAVNLVNLFFYLSNNVNFVYYCVCELIALFVYCLGE